MDDRTLARKLASQDSSALAAFYERFVPMIRAIAFRFTSDTRDVEEVVQDVAWTVFRKAHTFRGDSDFKGWVHRIAQNAARMQHRKRKRAPLPLPDEILNAAIVREPDADIDTRPERMLAQRAAGARMAEAYEELDDLNKQVFEVSERHRLTPSEAAQQLRMSLPAYKARLHRVRSRLREAAVMAM